MSNRITRRQALSAAALGAGATLAPQVLMGTPAHADPAIDAPKVPSTGPQAPYGEMVGTLLRVDGSQITITIADRDMPITLEVPSGISILRGKANATTADLVVGDDLFIGVEFPPDQTWVKLRYINANYRAGLGEVNEVGQHYIDVVRMYDTAPNSPVRISITEDSLVSNFDDTGNTSWRDYIQPGSMLHYTGTAPTRFDSANVWGYVIQVVSA